MWGCATGLPSLAGSDAASARAETAPPLPPPPPPLSGAAAAASYSSTYRGVTERGGVWSAQIQYGGKKHYLGSYANEAAAARVYDEMARRHHGARARTNFDATGILLAANVVNRSGARDARAAPPREAGRSWPACRTRSASTRAAA